MGEFKEQVKYRDQDDPAHKGWGEDKASPFNPNGITLSLNSGWGQAAGWGNTGFDGGMDEGGMDDFTLHSPLPALTPKPAATLINAHSLMLDSLMQGKKLTGTKYLPGQVLEDADLLTHSLALQKQADEAAGVNQSAASHVPQLLQKHQTLASSATLPQQQAWHLHKGLQLLQDARDEGIIPGEDAERWGDSFKRSLAQDQANLLLNNAPHAIAQALQNHPLLVGLNPQDRQRLEQRAERRLHSLPLDHQRQQQQALLHQTGNRLKTWFSKSQDYLAQAGQLSPSELADLELTQALPQHTLNLLSQLSAHAVKQSAKHQAYLNRIQQGFKDQPLDPHNPDDLQAADYHFLLNHGKDSDQQLSGTLPDLFRLTGIVPKSAKPALSRLIHGRDGVKFSQRLIEAVQYKPNLASQLPDDVLLHGFAATAILPDWRQSGLTDDPSNRLYHLLTSPGLPPLPKGDDIPAMIQTMQTMRQLQDDLLDLEFKAAEYPDDAMRNRILPWLAKRRLQLAQYSQQAKLPGSFQIMPITPHLNKPDFIDRNLSYIADALALNAGWVGDIIEFFEKDQEETEARLGYDIGPHFNLSPIVYNTQEVRNDILGFIPQVEPETMLGRFWKTLVVGMATGGLNPVGLVRGGAGGLMAQAAKEAGWPEEVQMLAGLVGGYSSGKVLLRPKNPTATLQKNAVNPHTNSVTQPPLSTSGSSVNPNNVGHPPQNTVIPTQPSTNIPLSQNPLQNNSGTVQSSNNLPTKKFRSLKELKRNELPFTDQQILGEALSPSKNRSTNIGRGYQKHSDRPNSTLPKINDYQQRNAQAQQLLEDLLHNPDLRIFERKVGANTSIDLGLPEKHGFRFILNQLDNKLIFKGVLEPWLKK